MSDGEQRAIERAVPAGMIVRRESEAAGDGPYRELAHATLVVEATRRGRIEARLPYAILGCVLVCFALLAGGLGMVGAFGMALWLGGTLVASFVGARKSSNERVLAIADDHLQLAGGKRLLLGDVRKLEVVRRHDEERNREVACVVVHAQRAEVEVARVDEWQQAEFVEGLVDEAYRAYLRRGR